MPTDRAENGGLDALRLRIAASNRTAAATIQAVLGVVSPVLSQTVSPPVLVSVFVATLITLAMITTGGATGYAANAAIIICSLAVAVTIASAVNHAHLNSPLKALETKLKDLIARLLSNSGGGASGGLWQTDRNGHLTYLSEQLRASLGKTVDDIPGKSLPEVIQAAADDPGWPEFRNAMRTGRRIVDCLARTGCAGGETWWRIAAEPIFDKHGVLTGYLGTAFDVTSDRLAKAELAGARDAARLASETKTLFLGALGHELKTPLNAIVGFTELLASSQSENLSDRVRSDYLKTILDNGHHLQVLINDILDATRIERGTLRLVEQDGDLAELVEVAVKMCRDIAEKTQLTVIVHLVEGLEFHGDITRIKQALINLVCNAIKFSPAGGFIHVGIEENGDGGLAVAVRDSGIGIRSQDIDRIFEPFVQADAGISRRFGGIGLGLAIAREIAMLHGGNITIESEHGIGTTARLILPAHRITRPNAWAGKSASAA